MSRPLTVTANHREKFYWVKFGVLMFYRLDFFLKPKKKKKANCPVISWNSCVNHPRLPAREEELGQEAPSRRCSLPARSKSPCLSRVTSTSEYHNVLQFICYRIRSVRLI